MSRKFPTQTLARADSAQGTSENPPSNLTDCPFADRSLRLTLSRALKFEGRESGTRQGDNVFKAVKWKNEMSRKFPRHVREMCPGSVRKNSGNISGNISKKSNEKAWKKSRNTNTPYSINRLVIAILNSI